MTVKDLFDKPIWDQARDEEQVGNRICLTVPDERAEAARCSSSMSVYHSTGSGDFNEIRDPLPASTQRGPVASHAVSLEPVRQEPLRQVAQDAVLSNDL